MLNVQHDESHSRFIATVDGYPCVVEYTLDANTLVITHTGVPQKVGGRGIASELTQYVLDTARARGWSVVPQCAYAASYIARHPEYQDLVH